jgi:uncharacterized lipoprotein NlpE involved in copper resistance
MLRTETAAQPADMHTSRNAGDWAGTYEGVLSCIGCPGIQARLLLLADGQLKLNTQALGRQSSPQTASGRFAWNAEGSDITLDAAGAGQLFRVGEGKLLQLDLDGAAIPWNTPGRVLTQVPRE